VKRVLCVVVVATSVFVAVAAALGGCGDSCVDTGCVVIEAGPDVKEAGKKDAAKDTGPDVDLDVSTDVAQDTSGDAPADAETDAESDAPADVDTDAADATDD
jgi:hypothetical protein